MEPPDWSRSVSDGPSRGAEWSLPTGPGRCRPGLGPPVRWCWGEKIKLTLSGLGKMAPEGVETAVLFWVHLGTGAAPVPGLGTRTHSLEADSRSTVAIFPLFGSASGRPFWAGPGPGTQKLN